MGDEEMLTPRTFAAQAKKEEEAQKEFIRNRKLDAQEAERAQAKAVRAAARATLDTSAAEDAAARVLQGCWRMRSARNGVVELIRPCTNCATIPRVASITTSIRAQM